MSRQTGAQLISKHLSTLLEAHPTVVRECLEDPNTESDYRQRKASKNLAARAVAARIVTKAMEGSASHTEMLLDRTEGKVGASGSDGASIAFHFNLPAELPAGSAGEMIAGALRSLHPATVAVPRLVGSLDTSAAMSQERDDEYAEANGSD